MLYKVFLGQILVEIGEIIRRRLAEEGILSALTTGKRPLTDTGVARLTDL